MKNNKGFSLVELIVVIAIMAILAAVAIPTFASFIDKANVASDVSFVNDLTYAAELAHTATGDKVTDVQVTVADGVITAAAYKVGTEIVTIDPDAAEGSKVACNDPDIKKAAEDTYKAIDWNYSFKKYDDNTYVIKATDPKALDTATALEVTPPSED